MRKFTIHTKFFIANKMTLVNWAEKEFINIYIKYFTE